MDVCRLCLDVIIGDSFKLLDEGFVNMIQTIIPELNLDISTEPLSCMSCYNTLQQLYEFKSTCLKIEEDVTASLKIEEDIKPRYRKDGFGDFCIESNSNSNEFMQRKKNRFCRTCQVPIECESFTVLKPSEPDYYLDNMLVMCLPEIDLDIVENPVMCEKCLESLQRLHHFKSSCSNAEERIKSYMAQCGSNSMNQIDLSSVLDGDIKFSSSEYQSEAGQFDGVIKTEADDCIKEEVLTVEESPDDLFSEDECMLTEEDIKNEIGDDQQQKIEALPLPPLVPCQRSDEEKTRPGQDVKKCSVPARPRDTSPSRHIHRSKCSQLHHNGTTYQCKICSFSTKCHPSYKYHLRLAHGDAVELFSCRYCGLQTKYKHNLAQHIKKVHEGKAEVYNCPSCEFSSVHKGSLNSHIKSYHVENPPLYQCPQCNFKTKHKRWIKPHIRKVHDKIVKMLKCTFCPFESKNRATMSTHVRFEHEQHEFLQCNMCNYTTKLKGNLIKHINYTHADNATKHPCLFCDYKTKRKDDLRKHVVKKHGGKPVEQDS